jgi:hypothetical protein
MVEELGTVRQMTDKIEALDLLYNQIVTNLCNLENSRVRICLIQTWFGSFDGTNLVISGNNDGFPRPEKYPNWMTIDWDDEDFSIIMNARDYVYEGVGLIYEIWKEHDGENQNHIQRILSRALSNLQNRWRGAGDPLSVKRQKGLIGEFEALLEAYSVKGRDAILAWDEEGRALHDLDSESWRIEAKTTSSDSESVRISYPGQVYFDTNIISVLSVTRINENEEGENFSFYVNNMLNTIRERNTDDYHTLSLKVMSLGWNQATSGLFVSKFVLGETRFILIDEQTPAITSNQVQQFGELVRSVKYNLITETLESDSLQSLLGQS